MAAVSDDDRKLMLQTELRGIDVELNIKRLHHQVLTEQIEVLENDRADLVALLEQ